MVKAAHSRIAEEHTAAAVGLEAVLVGVHHDGVALGDGAERCRWDVLRPGPGHDGVEAAVSGVHVKPDPVAVAQREHLVDGVDGAERRRSRGEHHGADVLMREPLPQSLEVHPSAAVGRDLHPPQPEQMAHPLMGVVGLLGVGDRRTGAQLAGDEERLQVGDGAARREVTQEGLVEVKHGGDVTDGLPLQLGGRRSAVQGMVVSRRLLVLGANILALPIYVIPSPVMDRKWVLGPDAPLASETGAALFGSRTLAWALAHLTLHPDAEMSISDLARRLGTDYESTHRAVGRLLAAGLLHRRRMGREVVVCLPRARPELPPLRAVCLQAVSLGPALERARRALGEEAVADAFVFGSIAAGTDTAESDLDVMVLGESSLVDVAPFLRGLRDVLARDLQPLCRSLRHMRERLAEGSGFYRAVVTGPRIPLLEADLRAALTEGARAP